MGFSLLGIEDSTKLTIRITFRQRGNWQVGRIGAVVTDMNLRSACAVSCYGKAGKHFFLRRANQYTRQS